MVYLVRLSPVWTLSLCGLSMTRKLELFLLYMRDVAAMKGRTDELRVVAANFRVYLQLETRLCVVCQW